MGAALLLIFALALLLFGQFAIPTFSWPHRAPRLGIAFWKATAGAAIVSILLGTLALTMPQMSAATAINELLRACAIELKQQYSTSLGASTASASIAIMGLVGGRIVFALWRQRRDDVRLQRSHVENLSVLTDRAIGGVLVIDHGAAAVYCLQGDRRAGTTDTIVLTQGAVQALSYSQVDLVLLHERAHLNSRHSRLIARAHALTKAFPGVGFFRVAHDQIALLAEMEADDAVVDNSERASLAAALYRLATVDRSTVPPALAATGSDVIIRARRLMQPHRPLSRTASALAVALIVGLGVTPLSLALLPSGISESHACCLPTGTSVVVNS